MVLIWMRSPSHPPARSVWLIWARQRETWLNRVSACSNLRANLQTAAAQKWGCPLFLPVLLLLLPNWHSTLERRAISFLIQSDACQLPADAHSLTAITPGLPLRLLHEKKTKQNKKKKTPSLLLNAASTLIPHNNHFLPITAKQENLSNFQTMPLFISRRNATCREFKEELFCSEQPKGLMLNTGLFPAPFQDCDHQQPAALRCCHSFVNNTNPAGCSNLWLITLGTQALCHLAPGEWTKWFCY